MSGSSVLSDEHVAFFASKGILASTARDFGVRSDGNDILFPYPGGHKRRTNLPSGERRFSYTASAQPRLYGIDRCRGKRTIVVTEGEGDAMVLHQELDSADLLQDVGVCGLPGVSSWNTDWSSDLSSAESVYVILDNDKAYTTVQQVDAAWERISADLPKAVRVVLPADVKDVCEFFRNYELPVLLDLLKEAKNGRYHYKPIDWNQPVPPYSWLWDGWIARGDVCLLVGEPNCGKSFLAFDLAIALACGREHYFGKNLGSPGRVLYVDQENPLDIVRHRAIELGATSESLENIRYLHDQGIKLDRGSAKLLDEAKAFKPDLIVLDSLIRFHRREEASNNEMSALFEDSIKPLARKTGSALLVLHHAVKADNTNSFQRTRGAGDITGAADAALDMRKTGREGEFTLTLFKYRRRPSTERTIQGMIRDTEGGVEIVRHDGPF